MKERWPIIAFTALLTVAVGVQVLQAILAGMSCDSPLKEVADNKAICGPVEFWFSRYQTFVVGIATIGVAFIVLQPALTQAAEMRRQSAFSRHTLMKEVIKSLTDEINESISDNGIIKIAQTSINNACRAATSLGPESFDLFYDNIIIYPDKVNAFVQKLDAFRSTNVGADSVTESREKLVEAITNLTEAMATLEFMVNGMISGSSTATLSAGEVEPTDQEFEQSVAAVTKLSADVAKAQKAWHDALVSHRSTVTADSGAALNLATGRSS